MIRILTPILCLGTLMCAATLLNAEPPRPNIVIVMVDDMGYSDIGCYGGEITTPNIDRLAEDGIRFTQFYNTSRCCPTRASLLTGLYQHQTGVGHMTSEGRFMFDYGADGYRGNLNRHCVTLAEVLSDAGYDTYMTGKWHLGSAMDDRPLQRGFDKFYGSPRGAFSFFKPTELMEGNEYQPTPNPDEYYSTDAFSDVAIDWIRERDDDAPFFLYLAHNAPHWPLHAKEEDIALFEGKFMEGWDALREARFQRQVEMGLFPESLGIAPRDENVRPWADVPEAQKKDSDYRMAVYAAQVYSVDENLGKLLAVLEEKDELDNTLILFLSDNGGCAEPYSEFGGGEMEDINDPDNGGLVSVGRGWANLNNTPFREYKNRPQEGGIATPFIAHWPNGITSELRGRWNRDLSHIIDVMPTVIELSGAEYPDYVGENPIPDMEGISLAPIFQGSAREDHEYLFFEHEDNCATRSGDWKIIGRYGEFDWELYNVREDRNELNDLAEEHPEIVDRLAAAWAQWATTHDVTPRGSREGKGYDNPKK